MEQSKTPLTLAIEADLARLGLEKRHLARKLNQKASAVSNWSLPNRQNIPRKHIKAVLEILGEDGQTAEWLRHSQREELEEAYRLQYTAPLSQLLRIEAPAPKPVYIQQPGKLLAEVVRLLRQTPLDFKEEAIYKIGQMTYHFDLATSRKMIEIAESKDGALVNAVYRKLVHLSFVNSDMYSPYTGGLIVFNQGAVKGALANLQVDATMMGIQYAVVKTPAEAVDAILEWETTDFSQEL